MAAPTSCLSASADIMYNLQDQKDAKTTILLPTPPSSQSSRSSSPSPITEANVPGEQSGASKKKKKKKTKKSAKAKESTSGGKYTEEPEERPPVLCISRNKHWRYISSYHVRLTVLGRTVPLIPSYISGTMAAAASRASGISSGHKSGSCHLAVVCGRYAFACSPFTSQQLTYQLYTSTAWLCKSWRPFSPGFTAEYSHAATPAPSLTVSETWQGYASAD
jgi:hypothetical protein